MVILYRETSIVKVATATVSENLFFFLKKKKKKGKLINMNEAQCDVELTFFRDNREGLQNR